MIDGIAAIVNNDVVTISQVRELIGARERSLREIYRGPNSKTSSRRCGSRRSRILLIAN